MRTTRDAPAPVRSCLVFVQEQVLEDGVAAQGQRQGGRPSIRDDVATEVQLFQFDIVHQRRGECLGARIANAVRLQAQHFQYRVGRERGSELQRTCFPHGIVGQIQNFQVRIRGQRHGEVAGALLTNAIPNQAEACERARRAGAVPSSCKPCRHTGL